MGELIRNYNWSQSSIGTPEQWPQALRISLTNVLNSGFPMFLFWGDDLTCFYNDAFRPSLGADGKHPAIGKGGKEVWAEIWDFIGPLIDSVLETGKPVWFENQLVPFFRNGQIEDIYWTFSYSLLMNDDRGPGGVMVTCMETTEALQGKKRVQESEARFRTLFETMDQGFGIIEMIFDEQGRPIDSLFLETNSVFEKQSGFKGVVGKRISEIVPGIENKWFEFYGKVALTGEAIRFTDGSEALGRWFDIYAYPAGDAGSNQVAVLFNDITEQVLARQKTEESETKYRTLFESMDQGYCTLEIIFDGEKCVDYRYLETNPTFGRHLGMTGALGKTIREIAPDIEPKWFDFYGGVALTGKPIRIEEESKALNKWFEVYAIRVGRAEEKKVGVFFTDVTERKASEQMLKNNKELLQTVFDASPNSLTVYEEVYNSEGQIEDFKFVIVNRFTIQTTGRSDLVGKLYSVEFPNVKETGVLEAFKRVATTGIAEDFEKWYEGEGLRHWFRFIVNKVGRLLVVTTENITKRKESEKAIQESEAKLRSILNSAPTAIAVFVGPDLIVENPNQLMIEVLAAGNDIEGQSFRKLLSGLVDEARKFIDLVDSVRASGESFEAKEVEVYFNAEEKTRYFNINFIPLRDENNGVYAVLDVSVDVTEQVLTRKGIEESEGRFRLLADAAPNLIWMLKPDGTYGYVNKTTLQFLGSTQEQMAESGWVPFQHPDDLGQITEAISKTIQTGQQYQMEHRLRSKDGQYRWFLSKATPAYDASGKVFAIVGSSIDIEEAKKSRQELQTALEQARLSKEAAEMGTFDLDLETGSMHWDERCRILFGISHKNPVTYEKDFVGGLHPEDRERILKKIEKGFARSVSNGDYDVEYRTVGAEDRVVRWVKAKGKIYFDSKETPVRFIGSVLDITEQKTAFQKIESQVDERTKELAEANQTLQHTIKELQRSNQNLEEFAHAASHDLKEPVRKILFFTQQLKDQLLAHLQEGELRSFNRIENASQRMGNLIDDLLLYSHVSQRPHETEPIDLNKKVQLVLDDLELDIEEKNVTIRVEKLPVVNGYPRQLQQLFQNLISNAIKYSKPDVPPVILINAEEVSSSGKQFYLISVKDNGIGFAQEYAAKIFQMFTRLHGNAEYNGTGVGLSIVKKVVENHNGFIEVESAVGEGSLFKIYLPQ